MNQNTISDVASAYKTTNITGKRVTDDLIRVKLSTDFLDYIDFDGILASSIDYLRVCRIIRNNAILTLTKGDDMTDQTENVFIKLTRETSKYNKYMKWLVEFFQDDMSPLCSEWFKTRKAAEQHIETSIWKGKKGFPIGNRMSFTNHTILS